MKKLKVGIVEDEFDAQRILKKYLTDSPYDFEDIKIASNYDEGIKMIESFAPDLLFMDINLDGESGIELVTELKIKPIVIFTTAHTEYAIDALRLKAQDYLLKPISPFDFKEALNKAIEELKNVNPSVRKEEFVVSNADGSHMIKYSELNLIEASGSYSSLCMSNNERILISKPLNYFVEMLENRKEFFRCHKSFLINTNCIQTVKYGTSQIIMSNGFQVPFSRSLKQVIKKMNG